MHQYFVDVCGKNIKTLTHYEQEPRGKVTMLFEVFFIIKHAYLRGVITDTELHVHAYN